VDSYDHVRIINQSAKALVIDGIDVADPGATPSVQIDTNDLENSFDFDVTHTVLPTLIDVENDDRGRGRSNVILAGPIENPIGTTRIVNNSGDFLSGGSAAVVRAQSLDVEASGSVGTAGNRLDVELVESVAATGALRLATLTATAGTGDLYLDLRAGAATAARTRSRSTSTS